MDEYLGGKKRAPKYERDVHGSVWTRHGFAIDGKDTESVERPRVARCGGINWCDECKADAVAVQ